MRLKFIRSIGIVFGITALLLVAPAVCAASMDMPSAMQSNSPCQQGNIAGNNPCFTSSSASGSHCILVNAIGERVKPTKLVSSDSICLAVCLEDSTGATPSQVQVAPYQNDVLKVPIPISSEHHCRNLLSSEEPPL